MSYLVPCPFKTIVGECMYTYDFKSGSESRGKLVWRQDFILEVDQSIGFIRSKHQTVSIRVVTSEIASTLTLHWYLSISEITCSF